MPSPPRLFDRALHRKRLDRAAPGYAEADFLKRRAAQDVAERLEPIMREFPVAVDLAARSGQFRNALAESDAAARVGLLVEADLSAAMLKGRAGPRIVADEERLPFAEASLDLVVSTLALHWTNDVVGALIQIRRALKPDSLFIGAFLGGVTLTELRQSLVAAEASWAIVSRGTVTAATRRARRQRRMRVMRTPMSDDRCLRQHAGRECASRPPGVKRQTGATSTGMPFNTDVPDGTSRNVSSAIRFELTPGFARATRVRTPST